MVACMRGAATAGVMRGVATAGVMLGAATCSAPSSAPQPKKCKVKPEATKYLT